MIIETIDNLINRLNNMFTVQTQEVIPELNKIKEMLMQAPQKETKPKEEVKPQEIKEEVKVEQPIENKQEEPQEKPIEELRKEYIEKFGKKPFAWWNREILISKMV